MTGKAIDILVAGRVYCDLLFLDLDSFPALGRESFAEDFAVAAGGGAFITAAHLAGLGGGVSLLSHLGTDPFSAQVAKALDRSFVDQRWITKVAGPLPRVTAAIVRDGDRAFVTRATPAPIGGSWPSALKDSGARWLHIADGNSLEDFPDLVARAKDAGLMIAFDCGWHADLLHSNTIWQLLPQVDLFLPNASEAAALCGGDETPAAVIDAARRLAETGPTVVVKNGARGAVACEGESIIEQAPPAVQTVDTTGAGDAFNAGILFALSRGWPLEKALRLAAALGAWTVQRPGGAVETPSWPALVALGAPEERLSA